MRIGSLLRLYSGFNSSRSISSWNSSPAAAQNAGCHWSLSGAFFKLLPPVCVNHDSATSQFVFVHKCLVFTSFLFVFPSAIFLTFTSFTFRTAFPVSKSYQRSCSPGTYTTFSGGVPFGKRVQRYAFLPKLQETGELFL